MARWAAEAVARDQMVLFAPTLDAVIGPDHPVRLFDEILAVQDWSAWEAAYPHDRGQPPIHPRVVASAILYGLSQGIRSSRRLEWACGNAFDFYWLVGGRSIDHATFCAFRTRFGRPLKDLFVQLGRTALAMGVARLNRVVLDGTRVKANCRREGLTAEAIARHLAALEAQVEGMLAEAQAADAREEDLYGGDGGGSGLPGELADLQQRRERLAQALAAAEAIDAKRAKRRDAPDAPARVPVTDPEAKVLPNKEGGHAPNYTPTVVVEGHGGLIVDADVLADEAESSATVPSVDRVAEAFGTHPEALAADGAFATGAALTALAAREIEAYMPVDDRASGASNPAEREDPRRPVTQAQWANLPRDAQQKNLSKRAFIYDEQADAYICPMGRDLPFAKTRTYRRRGGERGTYRVYRCGSCADCPLRGACLPRRSARRSIFRDEHEAQREAMRVRLGTPAAQAMASLRRWRAEGTLGVLKAVMGVRQFLLRGRQKVRTEWLWACTAFDLKKLVAAVGRLRRQFAAILA
ncbi:MAG: IS1182 family transposase [Planctomycetes bacterium]|nr:IS1182 family transposase [Planctomycetota bacterium]